MELIRKKKRKKTKRQKILSAQKITLSGNQVHKLDFHMVKNVARRFAFVSGALDWNHVEWN